MGVVPIPPPAWMNREELIEYRDFLERQRRSLPFANLGPATFKIEPAAFPSSTFLILLAALAPWVVSVALKLWIGDWTI